MRLRLARAGGHGTRGTRERVGHDGRAQGRGGEEGGWGGVGLVRRGGTVGGRPHPRAPPWPQKSFPKNTVEPGSPANLWQRAKRHKLTVSANNRGPGCARDFAAVLENRAISRGSKPVSFSMDSNPALSPLSEGGAAATSERSRVGPLRTSAAPAEGARTARRARRRRGAEGRAARQTRAARVRAPRRPNSAPRAAVTTTKGPRPPLRPTLTPRTAPRFWRRAPRRTRRSRRSDTPGWPTAVCAPPHAARVCVRARAE